MKQNFTFFFLAFVCLGNAQIKEHSHSIENIIHHQKENITITDSKFVGVEFEMSECITEAQRFQTEVEIMQNRTQILQNNPHAFEELGAGTVSFIEPYRPRAGFDDYGYHTLQNQVDHNLTPNNNLLDYNCGARTYDWANGNHQGTDYILWPYPWKRMSEDTMEVVAAANGVIVNKRDGYNDTNCVNNGNPNWNGFVLEHADGSQTYYWHFKKNTLNAKNIGDSVSAGEYLGIAGSSGSSTIPHLHFEVRDADNNVIDPYQGDCNSMNAESWWQTQENYAVPRINRLSTHYVSTQDTACPVIENTYERLNFLPGDFIYLKLYFRDINNGDLVNIKIEKPNGETQINWDWTSNWGAFYATAYGFWEIQSGENWMDGVYTVTVNFGGNTYETIFGINTNLGLEETSLTKLTLFPNPVKDVLTIQNDREIESVTVIGLDGTVLIKENTHSHELKLNVQQLPKGNYIVRIKSGSQVENRKFIKK